MVRRLGIAATFLLSLAGFAAAQPAPSSEPPLSSEQAAPSSSDSMESPAVGDHWTYELHDEITGQLKNTATTTITDISNTEIAVRVETPGFPPNFLIFDHNWNVRNNNIWKFTPNDGTGIKPPLSVGNTWKFQGDDFYSGRGVSYKRSGSSKVVGQETVTTSAGTFDTFKIETTLNAKNANDPTKTGQSVETTWYAPSVDHWVKRLVKSSSNGHVDSSSLVELVEYGRR